MKFALAPLVVLAATSFGLGLANPVVIRDVYAPKIYQPNHTSEWEVGTRQWVFWDISDAPKPEDITDLRARIVLRKDGKIMLSHVLAENIYKLEGSWNVTTPNVPTGKYSLVLFGDSGNVSGDFCIYQKGEACAIANVLSRTLCTPNNINIHFRVSES